MGGFAIPALMIASQAASAAIQHRGQSRAARSSYQRSQDNFRRAAIENARQQRDLQETGRQQASDRIRQSQQQLGRMRTLGAQMGASPASLALFRAEQAYAAGLDQSRISRSVREGIESIQAETEAGRMATRDAQRDVQNQVRANRTGLVLDVVGSGLQIGANEWARRQQASRPAGQ